MTPGHDKQSHCSSGGGSGTTVACPLGVRERTQGQRIHGSALPRGLFALQLRSSPRPSSTFLDFGATPGVAPGIFLCSRITPGGGSWCWGSNSIQVSCMDGKHPTHCPIIPQNFHRLASCSLPRKCSLLDEEWTCKMQGGGPGWCVLQSSILPTSSIALAQ